ncbi:pentatricopeptide repeat-containing protein At4g39952, mitochondrial [Humulus lupulus]|uniref:pentatricopeptide repeat-containing protein At4g39952, mitochondrial n=1 Tax=Humulus lupulus TaxID=3486 RepID=UPI002B4109D1|nr:pentatricopeptide repeat-containing protein At4g39952, mitochondrial [Humulus lupulus]XP_062099762.1 pentatricopeptide repeat-containing protein At4g39952, mitochondrial [Humulus lupulus]
MPASPMLALSPARARVFKRFPSFLSYTSFSAPNSLNDILSLFLSSQNFNLQSLLTSHALIITSGNSHNVFTASKLISHYASLKGPTFSSKVFGSVHLKDTFLWNSIIKAHFSNGDCSDSLYFFFRMRASGFVPNEFTLPMVVASCADLFVLDHGKSIHGLATKIALFQANSAVGSSFVYMYAKCGEPGDAHSVFDEMSVRDVVAWTALVIGYVHNGDSEKGLECLCEMHRIGGDVERPNFRTLEGGLQACGNLNALVEGRCLHSLLLKTGIECSEAVKSLLLSMYSKCGTPVEAYFSFCEVMNKDLLSWMSVISIYSRFGLMDECLSLFWEMQIAGIIPDEIVISCILHGFGNSLCISSGKVFHGLMIRQNYLFGDVVQNAMLFMYCKFGLLNLAEKLFSGRVQWNKESCSSMISGYYKIGYNAKCIELFREMQYLGIEADSESLVSVISSCCQLGATVLGRSLHCYLIKNSIDKTVSISNSLIDMYGKSSHLTLARRIFCRAQRDIITWNTMISSYIHNSHFVEAIALFDQMLSENLNPNPATLVMVLSACSHLASLDKGEKVHHYIMERGLEINVSLGTALVDMYAKCGKLEQSRELFDSMREKDVISWNVMISSYGMHGHAKSAIDIFQDMEHSHVQPSQLTFLALLSACNHSGLVEEGKYLFNKMQKIYALKPNLKHYACMVDLFGRSGNLQDAEALVLSMPISPDGGVWGSLLSACIKHHEYDMGVRVARHAIESDPGNDGYYILLTNMYSSSGRWDEAENVRKMMKERGVDKGAGWSVI